MNRVAFVDPIASDPQYKLARFSWPPLRNQYPLVLLKDSFKGSPIISVQSPAGYTAFLGINNFNSNIVLFKGFLDCNRAPF